MDQMSFGDGEYESKRKRTRETFLAEMGQVIPWTILLNLIEPFDPAPASRTPGVRQMSRGRIKCLLTLIGDVGIAVVLGSGVNVHISVCR